MRRYPYAVTRHGRVLSFMERAVARFAHVLYVLAT